jgi:hypothetical protein
MIVGSIETTATVDPGIFPTLRLEEWGSASLDDQVDRNENK